MPRVNIAAMNQHLEEISRAVTAGAHAALVVDGAGWHRPGGDLKVPSNITLIPLPPYTPELNPVENIWQYLRGNKLSLNVWQTYDEIMKTCCDAWKFFINGNCPGTLLACPGSPQKCCCRRLCDRKTRIYGVRAPTGRFSLGYLGSYHQRPKSRTLSHREIGQRSAFGRVGITFKELSNGH
jgi:hypothetical protein